MAISFGDTKYYIVSHRGAGHSLNVHGNNTITNNRNVNIYFRERTNSQRWIVRLQSPGAKIYSTVATGTYALDYYRGSSNYGNADVYIAEGNDQDSLVDLRTVDAANNLYRIQLIHHPTMYLTASGTSSGSDVRWTEYDENNDGQVWKFVPLKYGHYFLTATGSNAEQVQETIDYMEDCGYEVSRSNFPMPDSAYFALQYSNLWVIHGHGEEGRTLFQVSSAENTYNSLYASHFNVNNPTAADRYLIDLEDGALENTVFGLFTSCYSAAGGDNTNMAKMCYNKSGGSATIAGYLRPVAMGEEFSQMLFWHLMQGKTIGAAIDFAKNEFISLYGDRADLQDVDLPTDAGNLVVYGNLDRYLIEGVAAVSRNSSTNSNDMDAIAANISSKNNLVYEKKRIAKVDEPACTTATQKDESEKIVYYFVDQDENRYGYNEKGELISCMFNLPIDYDSKKIAPSIAVEKVLAFMKALFCQEFEWSNVEVKDSWVNGYEITAEDIADTTMHYVVSTNADGEVVGFNKGKFISRRRVTNMDEKVVQSC